MVCSGLVRVGAGCAVVVTVACGGEDLVESPAPLLPAVTAVISPNPHNVLSSVITFNARQVDSARVVYVTDDGITDSTPYVRVLAETDTIVTLGLSPATRYRNVLEAVGPGGITALSDTLTFSTSPLPDPLTRVRFLITGSAEPGFTLTSLQVGGNGVFALAFDSAGAIRWYRRFEGSEPYGGELKQQTNGHFTLYRGASTGVEPIAGHFVEFTPAGDSIRAISVAPPLYLDNHDLLITSGPNGQERFHFFTYDRRIVDLTSIGGAAQVSLAGHQLVRQRADGSTEFEWNAWDHLDFEEWIELPKPEASDTTGRDFDHPNSLAFDLDGDYIVSFRQLGQVMKINAETGEIIWRLGGLKSDYTFLNDPFGGFSAQHSARVLPGGNLLLYDNGSRHQPPESRAVEYALDIVQNTANMVWQFRHQPPIYTSGLGLVQRLRSGSTFIAYGQVGRSTEVAADGTVRWEADLIVDGAPALVYRMVRIASLYQHLEP